MMRKNVIALCTTLACGLALAAVGAKAWQGGQRPSPPAHAEFTFDNGKTIKINYSSPRVRGRKIFGDLQPYGKVWRAGANEATLFITDSDLVVGGKDVPAGEYSLDVIPNESDWTLIVNKKTKNDKGGTVWGIPYPGEQFDLTRTPMHLAKTDASVEDLTYSFDKSGSGCVLHLKWADEDASVEIKQK
jgi:DUF2911 family protein